MQRAERVNVHRFLEGYGVKVQPIHKSSARHGRPANVVYGGRTMRRLIQRDSDRAATVVMCIQASNPSCFVDVIIMAVWTFVSAHAADRKRNEVIAMFRTVDLAVIYQRANQLVAGRNGRMGKSFEKIATLLADRLLNEDMAE